MAMMPASGSAITRRLVRLVPLTGLPAHAVLLTKTTNAIVPTQTSRFDHRCDTPALLRAVYDELALTVILLGRIDRQRQRRLGNTRGVLVAIECPRFDRVDAHEFSVLDLHADQARAPELAADIDLGSHAVRVEVVHVAD